MVYGTIVNYPEVLDTSVMRLPQFQTDKLTIPLLVQPRVTGQRQPGQRPLRGQKL
jgi:hypothetical protein